MRFDKQNRRLLEGAGLALSAGRGAQLCAPTDASSITGLDRQNSSGCSMRDSSAYGLRMTGHQNQCGELLVLSQFEFEGFRTVMPAQAGIQGEQAAASGYSAWIPAFAGMTQHSSTPQNHHDRLLGSLDGSHSSWFSRPRFLQVGGTRLVSLHLSAKG